MNTSRRLLFLVAILVSCLNGMRLFGQEHPGWMNLDWSSHSQRPVASGQQLIAAVNLQVMRLERRGIDLRSSTQSPRGPEAVKV